MSIISAQATISPTSLVRLGANNERNNESICGKMVDWAVVLRPVGNLRHALPRMRQRHDDQLSLNHTRYGPSFHKPIVISVLTNPEGANFHQVHFQLAVWASAHMNFLCQLLTGSASSGPDVTATGTALPHLPLLRVYGSQWSFLFASRRSDGRTVRCIV
jgi:hypothetical protein